MYMRSGSMIYIILFPRNRVPGPSGFVFQYRLASSADAQAGGIQPHSADQSAQPFALTTGNGLSRLAP
jgi:hypothetical protein